MPKGKRKSHRQFLSSGATGRKAWKLKKAGDHGGKKETQDRAKRAACIRDSREKIRYKQKPKKGARPCVKERAASLQKRGDA